MSGFVLPVPFKPAQISDPMDDAARLQSISRMKQQGDQQAQMFPEQLKEAQLQNQARQQDMKDQQIWADAYKQNKGDIDGTLKLAAQNGASGKSLQAAQVHNATVAQHLATVKHENLQSDILNHDAAYSSLEAYRANPNQKWKEDHWEEWLANQNKAGHFTTAETQQYLQQYPKYDDTGSETMSNNLMTGKQYTEKAEKLKADQDRATRTANDTRKADAVVKTAQGKQDDQDFQKGAQQLGNAKTAAEAQQILDQQPGGLARRMPAVPADADFDPDEWRAAVDKAALNPDQRTRATQAETNAANTQTDRDRNFNLKTGKGGLTPNAAEVKNRFTQREINTLQQQEQGTAGKPGFYGERAQLRQMLTPQTVTDDKGNPVLDQSGQPVKKIYARDKDGNPARDKSNNLIELSGAAQDLYKSKLRDTEFGLQQIQFKKAKANGYGVPDAGAIKSAPEGQPVQASDGTIWKKQDGIMYTQGEGARQSAAPSAPQASASTQFKIGDPVRHKGRLAHITGFDASKKPLIQYDDGK